MMNSFVRGLLVVGLAASAGLGCAAQTSSDPAPGGSETDSDAVDGDENLGTSQQALTNCALGDAPNETSNLVAEGSSASLTRGSTMVNAGGFCGANWRRVSIVDYTVDPLDNNDLHTFDVKPYGNISEAECFGLIMYVRLQLWDPSDGGQWKTVDYQHGNPDNQDADYNSKLRGRLNTSTFECIPPAARLGRTNYLLAGSTRGTAKYRLRAYITKSNGTNAGLTMKGHNEG